MSVTSNQVLNFEPRGAALDLMWCREPEILLEGPAGTGKTRALLEYIFWLCETVPGIRVLMCRQTRASMTESVLVTWEAKVVPPLHSCLKGLQRKTVTEYDFANGSHCAVGGLDNPDRIMSTEYDIIALFEATEASEDSWEKLQTRLRNNILGYQQGVCDCNPAHTGHWLNRRAARDDKSRPGKKVMARLLSRHEDNPSVTAEYLRKLDNLTGARYERLRKGLWVAQEGLVYSEWDPAKHVVRSHKTRHDDGSTRIRWYMGSIDWGFRAPGCFQVWGIDKERRMYRVLEVYKPGKSIEWWADKVEAAHEEYDLQVIACDSAEPRNIDMMNDRLGVSTDRKVGAIAIMADKSWMAGRDLVGELLQPTDGGEPLMYYVDDALSLGGGRDAALAELHKPVCTEDEFLGYTWDITREGQPIKESPQKDSVDHGLDTARYAAMYVFRNDLGPPEDEIKLRPGSIGDQLGWADDL